MEDLDALMISVAHDHMGIYPMGKYMDAHGKYPLESAPDSTSIQYRHGWNAALIAVRKEQVIFLRWIKGLPADIRAGIVDDLRNDRKYLVVNENGEVEVVDWERY